MLRDLLYKELVFKTARSSGPGGQHVNKTNTKVILRWSLKDSLAFSENEKLILGRNLAKRLDQQQTLQLSSSKTRSQFKNKQVVIKRFFEILEASRKLPKIRKKTKNTKASQLKRLTAKRVHSEKKQLRKKPGV